MNPQKIKAVIFDLDGLLIDSEPIWNRAYYKFIETKNLPHEPEIAAQFVGKGLKEIIQLWQKRYGLKGDQDKLLGEYRKVFYDILFNSENFHLMDGADELIKQLNGKYQLAVCTGGHDRENTLEILQKLGIGDYFDAVVSSDDVRKGKPAPDVYLKVAKALNIDPRDGLVLEDSVNGIISAKGAGIKVYGVNPELPIRDDLEKQHPDGLFASLSEIKQQNLL